MRVPFLTQPKLTSITGARPDQLQTWVNRDHLKIDQPNPGRGKSRLYSTVDAVKTAIMVRFSFFGVPADKAAQIAEYAARRLSERGSLPWDEILVISFAGRDTPKRTFIAAGYDAEHLELGIQHGDAGELKISDYSEWYADAVRWIDGIRLRDDDGEINQESREKLALSGLHAEPFLFFPLGEVVNAVIARAEAER